jgi:hypothetical protein
MPRNHDDDPDFEEEEPEGPEYVDWEANQELAKKLLNILKTLHIHEALLTLVAACDLLMKNSPKDWDHTKVKQVLPNI